MQELPISIPDKESAFQAFGRDWARCFQELITLVEKSFLF